MIERPRVETCPLGPSSEFVVASTIRVPVRGASALEAAFSHRLREVDEVPGFRRLEVWSDLSDETCYLMVSWWDSHDAFLSYMRSDAHRRSHDRIPTGAEAPRPAGLSRYTVVAT